MDLASGLLYELAREAGIRVRRPLDEVQRTFAFADLRRERAPTTDSRRRHAQRRRDGGEEHVHFANPTHPCPPGSISKVCSGRHSRRTRWPLDSSASWEDASRFCFTTVSSPPPSSSTVYRVNTPT